VRAKLLFKDRVIAGWWLTVNALTIPIAKLNGRGLVVQWLEQYRGSNECSAKDQPVDGYRNQV